MSPASPPSRSLLPTLAFGRAGADPAALVDVVGLVEVVDVVGLVDVVDVVEVDVVAVDVVVGDDEVVSGMPGMLDMLGLFGLVSSS